MLTEFNALKNVLNGIPDSIGGLSCLIHLDLHQNNELFEQGVNGFLFLLSSSCLKSSMSVLCRNLINSFINHGLSFTCRDLFGTLFSNNNLSTVPMEIGALSHLGTLDLHSNQVARIERLKEYPVEACKLNLLVLDLSNNSLSGLPAEIGKVR
ncbi:plant intracellular Ras-group-related LRR protein 6-like [Arachis duranensis]|uniref:Plant intracellular Ras-group-related LRR protein 6-like n=1 Tax=Arachis duranensis TaxID=130453 RepID=A0A9C6TXC2_ARADU|nr:plant intracellular Ras-group-related LRR protein 6-like [Arachis duranensis]